MKKLMLLGLVGFLVGACGNSNSPAPEITFTQPANFPAPVYDLKANPVTTAGFELGKALFYDELLSRDGTISCASCHQQFAGFTQHGHDLSHGIDDLLTLRNAQPIQNLAWQQEFFWDGGVFHLDLFAISPIEAPNEMGETIGNVLNKLRKTERYPAMFQKAFGSREITTERFLKALSQFQLMCISANSPYDRYVRKEGYSLTPDETAGMVLFQEKCVTCHQGQLFSDFSYRNNGLPVRNQEDNGRARITLDPNDDFKFRVPSLRNAVYTAPYMHDGRFRTLESVLDFYRSGVTDSPTLDPLLKQNGRLGIAISDTEKAQIIAFLKTLTDESFINNPLLAQ